MFLARERYGFVPWVVLFLVLTWASTLILGRKVGNPASDLDAAGVPGAREEAASYVMRTLYQETLFFLIPFYVYSTVLASPNVVFVAALGALALVSCLDLVFDRLLRTRPLFALIFFATVAFAAINLVLPMLWSVSPKVATIIAGVAAVASALPLALRTGTSRRTRWMAVATGGVMLATVLLAPVLIPPVPLRMDGAVFSGGLVRETLEPVDVLGEDGTLPAGEGALYVVMEIFAPAVVPTAISLEWRRDGETLKTSRDIVITAHDSGFRVWDALQSGVDIVRPGRYQVTVRTSDRRIFGRAEVTVHPSG